ncbi:PhzF family phenazine biosynthesis protein [Microbacterium sp. 179-I 1D1 NHS]|uniref:PhzF family phenazine biosynthesis protein n=1 Tax=Microbacterium sp. 179-I 1D1 NHS TaxID=3374298 RepID=UPI003879D903
MPGLDILRYAAFTTRSDGGNPAGVVLDASTLDDASMQRIAVEIDFSETAFVTGVGDDGALTIRYFSPIAEVPFCGHATVAAAVALADAGRVSAGAIRFATPVGVVVIQVSTDAAGTRASFTSIEPSVSPLTEDDLAAILDEIGLDASVLDAELPPRIAHAGNPHPVVVVADRAAFDDFSFDAERVRALMDDRGWPATITVAHRLSPDRFVARNLFPVGRITEDPATGSAGASFGAYLRSLDAVTPPARVVIEQGAHAGRPGELTVDIPVTGGIVVSGNAVRI